MFVTLAFHHPRPEHLDDFAAFMKRVEDGMRGTDGLLSLESFRDDGSGDLVAIGRWQSAAHARAGVPRLLSIGGRAADWTERPDDLYQLIQTAE
ncbi:antibiotic biosynthesis monooxygenase family protein [Diaminobutyricibacter sp. McL0608]|uniref:antibiotic biosynthesis monooxygenase family protein n=1 Tax=Leifsonia sp. McL0608 TaxID=3143537 RepID=UPI0031F3198D